MKITADAFGAQLPHDVEENRDLALVERGRRLVHDHQPRLERHGAGDGDHLLDRGAEVHQRPAHVDLDREARSSRSAASAFMRGQSSKP